MTPVLETERLLLRYFGAGDTAFILELLNSPGWLAFVGDRGVRTEADALAYLEAGPFTHHRQHGFGMALVVRKEDQEPIGMCGLIRRQDLPLPDLGFAFLPEFHGKGYAREIAGALLEQAPVLWQMDTVLAITLPANTRSVHLLELLGFVPDPSVKMPASSGDLLVFRKQLGAPGAT